MPAKRGGSSTKGKSGATAEKKAEKKTPNSELFLKAKTINEVAGTLKYIYGIDSNKEDLKSVDFETLKQSCYEMGAVLDAFPQAKSTVTSLQVEELGNSYASATQMGGVLKINKSFYSNRANFERDYRADVISGYHPLGSNTSHILAHETGHQLETALVNKYMAKESYTMRAQARSDRVYATKVIDEAVKSLGLNKNSAKLSVSRYAKKNDSETLAECVAEYRARGSKSSALSREVWKILKRELG